MVLSSFKATMPPILIKSFELLKKSGYYYAFIIYYVVDLLFEVLTAWFLSEISEGIDNYVTTYIILKTIHPLISEKINTILSINIRKQIEIKFKEENYIKYNSLAFESKNKTTTTDFNTKLNDATNSISMVIDWGFPQIFSVLCAICSCFIIFVREKLYILGIIIILINIIFYTKFIKKLQDEYFKGRKERKKQDSNTYNIKTLYLPLFQYKEKNVKDLINLDEKTINNSLENNKQWGKISLTTSFTNNIGIFIFGMFINSSAVKLLLMLNVMQQFKNAITNLMNFLNWFSRMEMDFNTFEEFWVPLFFSQDAIKRELPEILNITSVLIENDKFKVSLCPKIKNISIRSGDKLLIQGKSGHGKTTFINGLMGKIKGVQFSEGNPEDYNHHFVEFYQIIKEKMPTSAITIRQLFNGDTDDEFIKYCCKLCEVDDFIDSLAVSKSSDHYTVVNIPNNSLDIEIEERISGGQKSRLALATRIHRLLTENKKILILDEPEQGSDSEIAYQIINNIIKLCTEKNVTLIVISHLESIHQKFQWEKKIAVHNGIISHE